MMENEDQKERMGLEERDTRVCGLRRVKPVENDDGPFSDTDIHTKHTIQMR